MPQSTLHNLTMILENNQLVSNANGGIHNPNASVTHDGQTKIETSVSTLRRITDFKIFLAKTKHPKSDTKIRKMKCTYSFEFYLVSFWVKTKNDI